jgi:hypothetical protein
MGICIGLAACTSSGPKIEADQRAVDHYRSSAWAPNRNGDVSSLIVHPDDSDTAPSYRFSWSGARSDTPRPVIVFFPGLGFGADSKIHWPDVWAKAGYLVVTVQPWDIDARIWTSELARSGDFSRVAAARFTGKVMAERLDMVASALTRLRRMPFGSKYTGPEPDWGRAVLAGDDLGAYTVQSLMRQTAARINELTAGIRFLAVLAISPVEREGHPEPRSADGGSIPILMISSLDDIDPYGIVQRIDARHQAFDELVSGNDYYLELAAASHRWLAGVTASQVTEPVAAPRAAFTDESPMMRWRKGRKDTGAPDLEDDEALPDQEKIKATTRAEREAEFARLRSEQLTRLAQSEVSVEQVSTAFLDAYVKADRGARDWLDQRAPMWLLNGDRLKHRVGGNP